jgi:hypothetical protein
VRAQPSSQMVRWNLQPCAPRGMRIKGILKINANVSSSDQVVYISGPSPKLFLIYFTTQFSSLDTVSTAVLQPPNSATLSISATVKHLSLKLHHIIKTGPPLPLSFAMSAMSAFAIVLPQNTTAEYIAMSMGSRSYSYSSPRPSPIIENCSNPNLDETYYHQYRTNSVSSSISSGSSKLRRALKDKIQSIVGKKNLS